MAAIITLLIVIVVCALACYAIDLIPNFNNPFKNLAKIVVILIGILYIVQGLL